MNPHCLQKYSLKAPASITGIEPIRKQFRAFLESCGLPQNELQEWELIFTEAWNNAVSYGAHNNPEQTIHLEWWLEGTELCLNITDPGGGPPEHFVTPQECPQKLTEETSRGLFLLDQLCEKREHWRGRGRNGRHTLHLRSCEKSRDLAVRLNISLS